MSIDPRDLEQAVKLRDQLRKLQEFKINLFGNDTSTPGPWLGLIELSIDGCSIDIPGDYRDHFTSMLDSEETKLIERLKSLGVNINKDNL